MDLKGLNVLLVDDEPDIIEFLTYNLGKAGFNVKSCASGLEAIEMVKTYTPNIILLDVMMPDLDGIETCEEMRKMPELENTVIALLTARSEDYSQIAGFSAGADDYITKPIRPKLLISRMTALLKRYNKTSGDSNSTVGQTVIKKAGIEIDRERYIATKNGNVISLPKKEFELLMLLMSKPDKVFTREEIFRAVWGEEIVVGDRTIDVHIRKLREKVGGKLIKTIKGVGYKFVE